MFKDFTEFNAKAHLLFKDEPFSLIMKAFQSFTGMLQQLRTEAYDYATWYNKVMRDKYEDGAPVDVTSLPYLSVPRSQLAVMRSRISKVRESVQYAANAITNIALGNKVSSQIVTNSDSGTYTVTGTDSESVSNSIARWIGKVGDLLITLTIGGSKIVNVNGVSLSINPLVRGTITLAKFGDGTSTSRVGFGQRCFESESSIKQTTGEVIRAACKNPLVVARSFSDLAYTSRAPVSIMIASIPFFGRRIVVWATSAATYGGGSEAIKAQAFHATLHADVCDAGEEKETIARSMYEYLSEDYMEAVSFDYNQSTAGNHPFKVYLCIGGDETLVDEYAVGKYDISYAIPNDVSSTDLEWSFVSTDVSEASTQTAIADLFFTNQEWEDLMNSLSEA